MATGEMTGPLPLANQLREWLHSQEVQYGAFHVGLLGVKADYWGVTHPTKCPPGQPLGCWYDERLPGYRRLDRVERIPFYVLVFGADAHDVTSVMESLQRGVLELDREIETESELLTRRSLGFETAMSCEAGSRAGGGNREPQYALFVDDQGRHSCVRDATVTLFCEFRNGFRPTGVTNGSPSLTGAYSEETETSATGSLSTPATAELAVTRINDNQLEIDIDCSAVRRSETSQELRFDVTGRFDALPEVDWGDWSTEAAARGRTLHLSGFVNELRIDPELYRVKLPPILRFPGS